MVATRDSRVSSSLSWIPITLFFARKFFARNSAGSPVTARKISGRSQAGWGGLTVRIQSVSAFSGQHSVRPIRASLLAGTALIGAVLPASIPLTVAGTAAALTISYLGTTPARADGGAGGAGRGSRFGSGGAAGTAGTTASPGGGNAGNGYGFSGGGGGGGGGAIGGAGGNGGAGSGSYAGGAGGSTPGHAGADGAQGGFSGGGGGGAEPAEPTPPR